MDRDFWALGREPPRDGITTVKGSVLVAWQRCHHAPLENFVLVVDHVSFHAWHFSRLVILEEYEAGRDVPRLIRREFFQEVFLWLTVCERRKPQTERTVDYRVTLARYWPKFLELFCYRAPVFQYAPTKIATYWGDARCRQLLSNVKVHFGEHVRGTVNLLLDMKGRRHEVLEQASAEQWDRQRRIEALRRLYDPVTRVKQALGRLEPAVEGLGPAHQAVYDEMLRVLRPAYWPGREFKKGTLYYDVKLHAREHVVAMIALSRFRDEQELRLFQALPLRRSHVPAAVEFDNQIVATHILGGYVLGQWSDNKTEIWERALRGWRREIQTVGGKQFSGHGSTDAVSCNYTKKPLGHVGRWDGKRGGGYGGGGYGGGGYGGGGGSAGNSADDSVWPAKRVRLCGGKSGGDNEDGGGDCSHAGRVEGGKPSGSRAECDGPASSDAGRAAEPAASPQSAAGTSRLGSQTQDRTGAEQAAARCVSRRFHAEGLKYVDGLGREELRQLPKTVVIDPGRRVLMSCMREDSKPGKGQRKTMGITAKQWRQWTQTYKVLGWINQRKTAKVRECERRLGEEAPNGHQSCTVAGYTRYLRALAQVRPTLAEFYKKPIFRKLRLWQYIRRQKADAKVVQRMRKFACGATLVIGDCSPPMARYHEPMPHFGLVRTLVKAGFSALLVDEYFTSQTCPGCRNRSLEKFKRVPNLRKRGKRACKNGRECKSERGCKNGRECKSERGCKNGRNSKKDRKRIKEKRKRVKERRKRDNAKLPTMLCHGLLRCTNCKLKDGRPRLWNRDVMACLNMIIIVQSLRETGKRPAEFQRPEGHRRSKKPLESPAS